MYRYLRNTTTGFGFIRILSTPIYDEDLWEDWGGQYPYESKSCCGIPKIPVHISEVDGDWSRTKHTDNNPPWWSGDVAFYIPKSVDSISVSINANLLTKNWHYSMKFFPLSMNGNKRMEIGLRQVKPPGKMINTGYSVYYNGNAELPLRLDVGESTNEFPNIWEFGFSILDIGRYDGIYRWNKGDGSGWIDWNGYVYPNKEKLLNTPAYITNCISYKNEGTYNFQIETKNSIGQASFDSALIVVKDVVKPKIISWVSISYCGKLEEKVLLYQYSKIKY
jgi:hypothetical protein